MALIELVKIALGVVTYLFVAPTVGFLIKDYRPGQRFVFALMVILTAFPADQVTLTINSINHTGHTRGFEISYMMVCAIILVFASLFGKKSQLNILPPGLIFYGLYCFFGSLTLLLTFPVELPSFLVDLENNGDWVSGRSIWEALFKFGQLGLIFIAAHAFVRTKEDILWYCKAAAVAAIILGTYALRDRYLSGVHRVRATFDHSNAMSIWAYMMAVPCLSVVFHRSVPRKTAALLLIGFVFGSISVILTVSRASFVILAALAIGAVVWGQIRHRGPRTHLITAIFVLVAAVVVVQARDTILSRFQGAQDVAQKQEEKEEEDLRVVLCRQASVMLSDSVFGIGWNNYHIACSRPVLRYSAVLEEHEAADGDKHSEETFYRNPTVESLYWYVLAETGYFGFASFAAFGLITLWFIFRNWWRLRKDWLGDFLLVLGVVLIAVYLHSTLEKVLLQTKNTTQWLVLLGMVSKIETTRRRAKRNGKAPEEARVPSRRPAKKPTPAFS